MLGLAWQFNGEDSTLPLHGKPSSLLGQGTRSHMLQLKTPQDATKIEDAACHNQDPHSLMKYINILRILNVH